MTMRTVEILGTKHTIPIMIHMLRHGPVKSSDLEHLTKNWRIVDDRLKKLEKAGLVRSELNQEGRMYRRYELTYNGRIVSGLLMMCARLDADTSYFEESDVAEFVEREIHNEGHSASRCV